jgi:hypothetical protein
MIPAMTAGFFLPRTEKMYVPVAAAIPAGIAAASIGRHFAAGIVHAVRTPAANGNANRTISLSTVISLLIFAKVAIIFVTLRGCALKMKI